MTRDARRCALVRRPWTGPWLAGSVILLAAALLGPPLAEAQSPAQPADSFVDRINVTAVELMIDVRGPEGLPVLGLEAADF